MRAVRTGCLSVVENLDKPGRELFIWAVLFSRMRIARIFWKTCPDQIGAALVANLMFKSMAHKAELTEELQMADELLENARCAISHYLIRFRSFRQAVEQYELLVQPFRPILLKLSCLFPCLIVFNFYLISDKINSYRFGN